MYVSVQYGKGLPKYMDIKKRGIALQMNSEGSPKRLRSLNQSEECACTSSLLEHSFELILETSPLFIGKSSPFLFHI